LIIFEKAVRNETDGPGLAETDVRITIELPKSKARMRVGRNEVFEIDVCLNVRKNFFICTDSSPKLGIGFSGI